MKEITTILLDIDGTVLDTRDFIMEAAEYTLLKFGHNVPTRSVIAKNVGKKFPDFHFALTGSNKDVDKFIEVYRNFQIKNYHLSKIFPNCLETLKKLKKKGYYLLAISHSPKGIVDPFAKRLGFDKVYGMFYELGPTDKFNGKIADEHLIRNKANILRRAVAKENLTLKGSIGVGDTEGDIPVFELVETPICFNPNMTLYRHAKRNKWKIVVERKDVIYELN